MDNAGQDSSTIKPNHLGFIVDGNRRWAKERGLTTKAGHQRGFDVLVDMAYYAKNRGIKHVSAFIFSTENWKRSQEEVGYLMDLFLFAFKNKLKKLVRDGFKVIFLGRRDKLSNDILNAIVQIEEKSGNNPGPILALCFNYGGRLEMVDSVKNIVSAINSGRITSEQLENMTEKDFSKYIYKPELPDLDILVRTSGEERLSGFQLWRAAYSELLFIDKNWPEMTEGDFDFILSEYAKRQRRFGV